MVGDTRKKNIERNLIFGVIKYIVTLVFPFICRTVIIYYLGEKCLGLGSLFSSILNMLSLSELGFSSAIVYALYKPIACNDEEKICALLKLFRNIYKICGCIILILGIAILPNIELFIKGTYPDDINIYIIFLILLINTAISYLLFGYREVLLVANQRNDIQSKIYISTYFISYIIQIFVIISTKNYYIYTLLTLFTTVFFNIVTWWITKKMYPNILCKGKILKEEKKAIYKNVAALFGHQIDVVIINSADNIVISTFLGLSQVAIYNNYFYIITALINMLFILANALVASIGNSIEVESVEKNYKDFNQLNFIFGFINIWSSTTLLCLIQPFMTMWMGSHMLYEISTVICLVLVFYVRQSRRVLLTYKNATGNWTGDWLKPYIAVAVNVILNIILVNNIGINGVIISTIISIVFVEIPWEAKVLFQQYFKKGITQYIKRQAILFVKLILVMFVTYRALCWIEDKNIFTFLFKGICCMIIPNLLMILLSYREEDYKNTFNTLQSMLFRK